MKHWLMNQVGRNIRALRKDSGWSCYKLSQIANLSPTHIPPIEDGKRDPGLQTLAKIAEALDVEPHLLLDPEMEKKVFETWEDDE